ncbi:MAG TPA: hypothetical protein VKG44_02225 [Candidatus Baltobacteraceae bacterium]|nr:hypothetical protein [Candidatus Baltobacteraceae bacterium]
MRRFLGTAFLLALALGATAGAQTPIPFKPPASAQHVEYTVEANAKGQVVRVTSAKRSQDQPFNAMTYGNALQVFIRKPDGTAVAGVYRLTYDYNPANKMVTRRVSLVRAGGVDANAPGAMTVIEEHNKRLLQAGAKPPSPLPDFSAIVNGK